MAALKFSEYIIFAYAEVLLYWSTRDSEIGCRLGSLRLSSIVGVSETFGSRLKWVGTGDALWLRVIGLSR